MKINNWSVVKSPNGISIRPLQKRLNKFEICLSLDSDTGGFIARLHHDGLDNPIGEVKWAAPLINTPGTAKSPIFDHLSKQERVVNLPLVSWPISDYGGMAKFEGSLSDINQQPEK